jgi:hypothetical protein
MPQHSGTFTGTLISTNAIVVPDVEQHKLELTIIAGSHRSEDPLWNGLWMTYYGVSDLVNDQGKAQGFFVNQHPDGSKLHGSFEASVDGLEMTGKYTFAEGTGRYAGITGGGSFTSHMKTWKDAVMDWSGTYQPPE